MTSEKMVSELRTRYQKIMCEKGATPTWAVHKKSAPNELVPCTIPFVGKHYANQEKKILVYASAENLVDYNERPEQDRFDEMDMAINRHRAFFQRPSGFFPNVHLQPMTDGALATAVAYLTMKLTGREPGEPREFYETIAFGNYAKYSMETELQTNARTSDNHTGRNKNFDYPTKKPKFLSLSHDYLRTDIEILKPDYIVLPKTIYENDKAFIDAIVKDSIIIPIYQINSTVVNCTIKRKHTAAMDICPIIKKWCAEIKRINNQSYLHVFTYLDDVLAQLKIG